MFDTNRRKYPRANYPCQLTIWLTEENSETLLANTANIGLGGLCVYLNQEIKTGTRVDVMLTFPDMTTPFKCRGKIVRSLKESDRFFNTGVEFEPLNEPKHAFLDGKIAEIMALEKGKT